MTLSIGTSQIVSQDDLVQPMIKHIGLNIVIKEVPLRRSQIAC